MFIPTSLTMSATRVPAYPALAKRRAAASRMDCRSKSARRAWFSSIGPSGSQSSPSSRLMAGRDNPSFFSRSIARRRSSAAGNTRLWWLTSSDRDKAAFPADRSGSSCAARLTRAQAAILSMKSGHPCSHQDDAVMYRASSNAKATTGPPCLVSPRPHDRLPLRATQEQPHAPPDTTCDGMAAGVGQGKE